MHGSCFNSTNPLSTHDLNHQLTALNSTVLGQSDQLQDPFSQEFRSASSSTTLLPQLVANPLDPFVVTSTADTIDANDGAIAPGMNSFNATLSKGWLELTLTRDGVALSLFYISLPGQIRW
jgi:hypothetical protein